MEYRDSSGMTHINAGPISRGMYYANQGVGKALGVAGGAAVGLAKLGGKAGLWGTQKIGSAGIGVGKFVGKAGLKISSKVGETAFRSITSNNPIKNPVGMVARGTLEHAKSLVKYTPARRVIDDNTGKIVKEGPKLKLTGKGKMLLGGAALLSGVGQAVDKFEASRLGTIDSKVRTNTPDFQAHEYNNAPVTPEIGGATGDLVFALFKNRRGGSLL